MTNTKEDVLMIATDNLLITQITMLILLLTGYVLVKINVIQNEFRKSLTDLIIKFILPCNIIKSFIMEFDMQIMGSCIVVLLVSSATQVLSLFLARLLFDRAEDGKRQPLLYTIQVSNAGFLGNPIVEGLYGAQGLLYGSLYLIPQRIMMWSYGITCFSGTRGKGVLKKVLTHPCIVAAFIGLVLMVTQLPLPLWLEKPMGMVGSCNTALSLIVIGGVLAELDPRHVISKPALLCCFVRLLLLPLLVLAGCLALKLDPLVMQISVILAGMPAPLTSAMLASQYGKDDKLAASLILLSTVASMVTIPMLCLLMMSL